MNSNHIEIQQGISVVSEKREDYKLKTMTKQRMFEFYKGDLLRLALSDNERDLRFLVIQYTCSFPNIDPYQMAAVLAAEGITILYDNSAITAKKNASERAKVEKLMLVRKEDNNDSKI